MNKQSSFQNILLFLLLSFAVFTVFGRGNLSRAFAEVAPAANNPPPIAVPPSVAGLQDAFVNIVQSVGPAVVNISGVHIEQVNQEPMQFFFGDPNDLFHQFFGDDGREPGAHPQARKFRAEAEGSGVIIDPAGYILTNNHVVQGAEELTVTLNDGKKYKGKLIGADPRSDLAVIKINSIAKLPFAPLGDSSEIQVGDWVLAFGSPFGLQHTVTSGIISARRQTLNIDGKDYRGIFQTDAAINKGNSGGPLADLRGEVIGINTAIYAPTGVFSGVGFAIPANNARAILDQLIKTGHVVRSWMGVEIREVDEVIAKQFGLPSKEGALVNSVVPGSPADKSGLKRGDVILKFDGKKVTDAGSLQDMVTGTAPKKKVSVEIMRGGKPATLSLVTEELPGNEGREAAAGAKGHPSGTKWLGATFNEVTSGLLEKYGQKQTGAQGVIATEVPPASDAATAGLEEGDIVRGVNRSEIKGLSDFEKAVKGADIKEGIVLDIVRKGESLFLSYKSL